MSVVQDELLRALDAHEALVVRCARGELGWAEFETAFDNLYPRYPLDGHESNAEELALLQEHADRITLHRKIWDEVLTKVTGDEHLNQRSVIDAGFIGTAEAVRRIQELAAAYLKL